VSAAASPRGSQEGSGLTRRPGLALLALALGGFTIGTTEFASMGLLTNIATSLHASIPATGNVITFYAIGVVVGAPVITVLAARMPRKALLILLMSVYMLGNVASSLAPSLGLLVAGRFVTGLSHGAFFGVGAVVGTAVVGAARRGHAVAMMMTGLTVANVLGVPMSSWVGDHLGWRPAFWIIAGLGVVTLLGVFFFVPRVPAAEGASVRTELGAVRNGLMWGGVVAGAIGFGGMFAIYSYVKPMLLEETGAGLGTVPVALAVFGLGMTAGTLLGGRLADRDVRTATWIGFIASAVSVAFTGFVMSHLVGVLVGLFLVGASSQTLGIGLQTTLMDLSPRAPSLGAALCQSSLNMANATGAFLGGQVIALNLGYPALAWTGVVLTVLGFGVMLLVERRVPGPVIPEEFRRPA